MICIAHMFQFTHPGKGATHKKPPQALNLERFNSRTLGRVRHGYFKTISQHVKFQFTHPGKGATLVEMLTVVDTMSFNSRTLGRVRL